MNNRFVKKSQVIVQSILSGPCDWRIGLIKWPSLWAIQDARCVTYLLSGSISLLAWLTFDLVPFPSSCLTFDLFTCPSSRNSPSIWLHFPPRVTHLRFGSISLLRTVHVPEPGATPTADGAWAPVVHNPPGKQSVPPLEVIASGKMAMDMDQLHCQQWSQYL
jgi:hypothetical protein